MTASSGGEVPLDGATTVLVLSSDVRGAAVDPCAKLLRRAEGRIGRAVAVTVTQSATDWIDVWKSQPGRRSVPLTCIDLDGDVRSVSAEPTTTPENVDIQRVGDPTNMERVGRRVSQVLQDADDDDVRVGVAVHSLSGIIQHVGEQTAFKFVYTLGEVVRKVDGVAFFHLDPDAHDDETIETFRIVSDAEVTLD